MFFYYTFKENVIFMILAICLNNAPDPTLQTNVNMYTMLKYATVEKDIVFSLESALKVRLRTTIFKLHYT